MPCLKPIDAYKSFEFRTASGKCQIFFDRKKAGNSMPIQLPCGQCIGCRIDRSKSWALRCVHEASLYDNNCFITLTFNDEHIAKDKSLNKKDFVLFMKRFRDNFKGLTPVQDGDKVTYPIRYFHCGEYGEQFNRPHHHACIFNFDFPDKELWETRQGVRLYRSELLEKLWPYGFSTLGDVNAQSAAYVARYCTKKITGDMAAGHYVNFDKETGEILNHIEPEYITMSRRPGIGKRWYDAFKTDVYSKDFVVDCGKIFKTPRYYDKLYDIDQPEDFLQIKQKRIKKACDPKVKANNTRRRLRGRLAFAENRFKIKERRFENGTTVFQYL